MHINKPRCYDHPFGINDFFGSSGFDLSGDLYNFTILDGQVAVVPVITTSINDFAVFDKDVKGLLGGGQEG